MSMATNWRSLTGSLVHKSANSKTKRRKRNDEESQDSLQESPDKRLYYEDNLPKIGNYPELPAVHWPSFQQSPKPRVYARFCHPKRGREAYVTAVVERLTRGSPDESTVDLIHHSLGSCVDPLIAPNRWSGLSKHDCTEIRLAPALILATKLIARKETLEFVHAFLQGPREHILDEDGDCLQVFRRKHRGRLSEREIDQVDKALDDLQNHIVFTFGPTSQRKAEAYTLTDWDLLAIDPARKFDAAEPMPIPSKSIVILNEKRINELSDLSSRKFTPLLRTWFTIAVHILHELMHALHNMQDATRAEVAFEEHGFAEMGHAWEMEAFGVKDPAAELDDGQVLEVFESEFKL